MIIGTRGSEELGGPLRIAQLSGEVAQGGIVPLLWFMAVLSVNLGLNNLFRSRCSMAGICCFMRRKRSAGGRSASVRRSTGFASVWPWCSR